ncbi:hypothetical protein G4H13_24540 [Streptomyces rapamycinicus]|uniref:Uncharacterized protein n=1 Tax=Streptomyces rhizosphaericus TaxID=114699 RepID=A0A6G4AJM8_9ACTN|nr:hypothetical protein [Streptomyces rhizosphaericus]
MGRTPTVTRADTPNDGSGETPATASTTTEPRPAPESGAEHEARRRWWKSLAQWWRRG